MFSITTPELLNKKQVSLYNARGNSSHGNRIKITMKPKRNSQSWEAGAKELGSSPYLRASSSSESEAPCRQDAPPSQPHRLSCGLSCVSGGGELAFPESNRKEE